VLVPSGSPGIVATSVPLAMLLISVDEGVYTTSPSVAPPGPSQAPPPTLARQRDSWPLKACMNTSAW